MDLGFEVISASASCEVKNIESSSYRFLLFGDSGMGKTMAACRAAADRNVTLEDVWSGDVDLEGDDSVFALLTETNGLAAAEAANPKIKRVVSLDIDTTRKVIRAAKDGTLIREFGTRRLVIDGLTEIQQQLLDDMYPDRVPEKVDWNAWNDSVRRFMRAIRSIEGMDIYCTALAREKSFEEGKPPQVFPSLEGRQAPLGMMQYFDAVGYMSRGTDTDAHGRTVANHVAQFTLPGRFLVKSCRALSGNVIPVMSAWGDALRGSIPVSEIRASQSKPADASPATGDTQKRRLKL